MRDSVAVVHELADALSPFDALEAGHITGTLRWLESTDDVLCRCGMSLTPDGTLTRTTYGPGSDV